MEKKTVVVCEWCGKDVSKPTKEVTRSIKIGRKFFCNNSCSMHFGNSLRTSYGSIEKNCALCGISFVTSENPNKTGRYCSRLCASKDTNNVTEKRRASAREQGRLHKRNLLSVSETLKKRESWKYTEMEKALASEPHEFEFALGNFVFDLLLSELRILIEFDGDYHRDNKQKEKDRVKSEFAKSQGYCIVRVKTDDTKIIPCSVLDEFLQVMSI